MASMKIEEHRDWNARLVTGCRKAGRQPSRRVRLPTSGPITVTGRDQHATISLTRDAVSENMQKNAACFEGWAIALRRWANADSVSLEWEVPEGIQVSQPRGTDWRHYQRFLYRTERFQSLFPEWFRIAHSNPEANALQEGSLFVNVAGKRTDTEPAPEMSGHRSAPEHELEHRLLRSGELNAHYKLGPECIKDRQFPVGLFSGNPPSRANAVFPGGKGAIDLVCLDGPNIWIFELKAGPNIPLGTLTELLFYTSLLRDAVAGRFRFAKQAKTNAGLSPDMLRGVKTINAVMLGHDLHPLLDDPAIFAMLNEAVGSHWDSDRIPVVTFRAGQLTENPFGIRDC